MSDTAAINAPEARNRVLSVFAGLGAMSLYTAISGSLFSVANATGLMDGWSMEATASYHVTLDAIAWILAALAVLTIGWWLRCQGSVAWGVAGLTIVGLADGSLRALNWIEAMQAAVPGEPIFWTSVSYFPFMMPVLVLVLLLLLGAGAQMLREKLK